MDQPDKTASSQPDQQSDDSREQTTHVIEPPKPEPHDDKKDDPQHPATDRREGVVSDPDVP